MLIYLICHLNSFCLENTACFQNWGHCIGAPAYGFHLLEGGGPVQDVLIGDLNVPVRALIENGNKS